MPPPLKISPPFRNPANVFMGGFKASGMNFTCNELNAWKKERNKKQ
jgi:hypothetical protein